MQKTRVDWEYYLEKSEKASLSIPGGCFWPRGKMLGGTSGINGMLYIRGNPRDYDIWEEQGNKGWGYNHILKYFRRSETNRLLDGDPDGNMYHGGKGPMNIDNFYNFDPIKDMVLGGALDLGYKMNLDVNAEEQMGFTTCQGSINYGRRQSSGTAFLGTILDRKNLHVIKNALVENVIINDKGTAEGINIMIDGKKLTALAKKEVILSAGVIGSAQILMQSGVGPKDHLNDMKIKVKKDLSVGKNLQDHAAVYLPIQLHKSTATPMPNTETVDDIYMYMMHKVGSLSHVGALDLTAFINTVNETASYPDIQFHHLIFRCGEEKRFRNALENIGYEEAVTESLIKGIKKADVLLVIVVLLNPKSVGKLELVSKNPTDKPRIYGNYLDNDEDVETLINGINTIKRFIRTKTYNQQEASILRVDIPGCKDIQYEKPGYWECFVRHMTSTVYHPVGTVKMGPDSDPEAVVDERLRVKDIKNLRVIDASIMPKIVSGNTNAPTVMIGEKGADMIKQDWTN